MRPRQQLCLCWLGLVHVTSGSSPRINSLDSANLIQKRLSGDEDPPSPDSGDKAKNPELSEMLAVAKELSKQEPDQPSDFDHFFVDVVGPDDITDPFEIKEEMLESCPNIPDEMLEKMEVLPFMTKEEMLAARNWVFENQTTDFALTKAKESASMDKPPWWIMPLKKKEAQSEESEGSEDSGDSEEKKPAWWPKRWKKNGGPSWPKKPWMPKSPWAPKMPWGAKKNDNPGKKHPAEKWKIKQLLGLGNSSNSSNSSNETTEEPKFPGLLPTGEPFIPPTMAPYIPSYEIRLLMQMYMPWANDLVLPMMCNRLAPIRDLVLTACYKMKVSREDCLENSVYTTGFFQLGQPAGDSEVVDISLRPLDVGLGEENKTVITWVRF